MARGAKDFTRTIRVDINAPFNTFDEVPPRLFSPVNFYRTGAVIYADDIANGLSPYISTVQGAGASIALNTTKSFIGAQSIRLTTGNAINDFARLVKFLPFPDTQLMGFECCFNVDSVLGNIAWRIRVDKASTFQFYELILTRSTANLRFQVGGGSATELESNDLADYDTDSWHKMKMIIDIENDLLVLAFFNNRKFTINEQSDSFGSSEVNMIQTWIQATTSSSASLTANVDAIVNTVDEIGE